MLNAGLQRARRTQHMEELRAVPSLGHPGQELVRQTYLVSRMGLLFTVCHSDAPASRE